MAVLPEWIEVAMESSTHDMRLPFNRLSHGLAIAWEALEDISNHESKVALKSRDAMRRIAELGKEDDLLSQIGNYELDPNDSRIAKPMKEINADGRDFYCSCGGVDLQSIARAALDGGKISKLFCPLCDKYVASCSHDGGDKERQRNAMERFNNGNPALDGGKPSYVAPCCGSHVQGQHIDCHNASDPDGGKA